MLSKAPSVFHCWEVCAALMRGGVIKSIFPHTNTAEWARDGATLPWGRARIEHLEQEESPTRPRHHHGTYWSKRVTRPSPRGISCGRKEESWIWLLCPAPEAPARGPHSPAWLEHLEAPVAQHDLAGRQRLPGAHLHALESWGAGKHGGTGLQGWGRTGTGASAPREPGSQRKTCLLWDRDAKAGMSQPWRAGTPSPGAAEGGESVPCCAEE